MRYGHFDDARREYVITTPDTPHPWINYMGCEGFFSLVSNTGGGYCFYKDARFRRILRYRYNNVPRDIGARAFYVNDGGDVWSPTFKPVRAELEHYECRHGLGYSVIAGKRNGVSVEVSFIVPLGVTGEVHRVVLKNESAAPKKLRFHSFAEWCLWNALDDFTNYQRNLNTGEVEIDGGTIYHKTEYRERRNHYVFYSCSAPLAGFESDRDAFLGKAENMAHPEVVVSNKSKNSVASGWSPIASHAVDVELAPGEEKTIVFLLGYVENPEAEKWEKPGVINKARAKALIAELGNAEGFASAMAKLQAHWSELLTGYNVDSADENMNRMVNIWNQYQCMITFHLARSASYFESGIGRGIGFRDSNQDILGFVHLMPQEARERLIDLANIQQSDGSTYHQFQPLTKKGNADVGGGFNDDPLWLILAAVGYVKETGDASLLSASSPFEDQPNGGATILDHLDASFNYTLNNRGPHGLPLIGRADWNDCLNLNCFSVTPDESFQTTQHRKGPAESVFIAGLFCFAGMQYEELLRYLGKTERADQVKAAVDEMKKVVLSEAGWDGAWFKRAYDFYGKPLGSKENDEGKIFIEPQGLCIMAGIGVETGEAKAALDSVREHLATDYGIVLQQPAYSGYHMEYGEITSYPPGYKENAGIFCHNNPWIMIAETVIGRGDEAYDYYKRIAPAYQNDTSDKRCMEPYVYAQMVAGKDAVHYGQAKNSWLTGTGAWNLVAITQHILGVRPEYEGLRIEPCLPSALPEVKVRRRYRGAFYEITLKKTGAAKPRLTVDGAAIEGTVVPKAAPGTTVRVVCEC